MERQNQKIRKKYLNEENARVIELISLSEKFDPRLIQEREQFRAKKEQEKEDRRKAKLEQQRLKREKEEEIKRLEIEKKEQEEARVAQAKEEKKHLNERKKKLRQRIKKCAQGSKAFDDIALNELLVSLEEDQLMSLVENLESKKSTVDAVLRAVKDERETTKEENNSLAIWIRRRRPSKMWSVKRQKCGPVTSSLCLLRGWRNFREAPLLGGSVSAKCWLMPALIARQTK